DADLGVPLWCATCGAVSCGDADPGGPAVPGDGGDPWPALDVPARALTVQSAALAIAKAVAADRPLDEVEQSLVDACDRMGAIAARPLELAPEATK
ncbi:aminoglycoside phosphotransferase family protein, partial [Streptomyces sp. NPDC005918]